MGCDQRKAVIKRASFQTPCERIWVEDPWRGDPASWSLVENDGLLLITERISWHRSFPVYTPLTIQTGCWRKGWRKAIVEAIVQCPAWGVCHRNFKEFMPLLNPRKNLVLMDGYYPPDYFYDLIIGTLQYNPPKSISTMWSHTHTHGTNSWRGPWE